MIKLDISVIIFLYLFFTVVLILVLWALLGKGSKPFAFRIDRQDVWQCSVCSHVYRDARKAELSRCPQCNSLNKKGGVG